MYLYHPVYSTFTSKPLSCMLKKVQVIVYIHFGKYFYLLSCGELREISTTLVYAKYEDTANSRLA